MKLCIRCDRPFAGPQWLCPACGFEPPAGDGFVSFAAADAGDGFHPEFFAELARLEPRHFWFRARNRLIVRTLRRCFPAMTSFLEVGCGTGYVLSGVAAAFPAARLHGSEYFSEGLPFAARRVPAATLCQMDARRLPFAGEFDVIGAFDVLEHIDEDDRVLAAFHRALRPGGGVILTVPQHRWLWSRNDENACHVRRYERAELSRKLAAAGLRVVYATSFVSLLLPALLATRRLRNDAGVAADPLAELRLSPVLNGVFSGIMTLELGLLAAGIRFPAGGSLLVVATRDGEE
ncbi:MAG: class I SAM-dependent methyltransferase [Deltaproteobacteria bacterium]|nr:MAG: class I SAM-dependent methyltransferase [Deltaproteobacteria bacterium]